MNKQERAKAIEDLARKLVANAENPLEYLQMRLQDNDWQSTPNYTFTIKSLQLINELRAVLGFEKPEETKLEQIVIKFD